MDINSFVIGFAKGKKSGTGFFSTKENDAGGLTYAFKATEGGGGSGGGVELNIAYGDTAPEDTTKLWVKTTQPSGVVVSPNVEYEVLEGDSITTLTETLPGKNYNMASATVGSKVYMFGGNGGLWQSIVCFDSETKIITTLSATLPTPLANMACASSGTKIYLFGGSLADRSYITSEAIYCFDTETEEITTLSAKVTTATQQACVKYGSGIYLFGGQYWSYFASNYKDYYRNSIQCFNIETETVTTLPVTIPSSRASMACACVGSKVYLFGGYYSSNTYSTIYRFDIETGTMAILASTLPKTLRYTRAEPLGDKIYLFGGSNGSAYYNTIICFDTKTETCEELPMNIGDARGKMGTSVVGETIYLFGGARDDSTTSFNTIQQFEGVTKVPVVDSGAIHIVPQLTENFFPFLNTDTVKAEIGVDSVLKGNADGHGEEVEAALYKDGAWVTI